MLGGLLEKLTVRITADTSGLKNGLRDAIEETKAAGRDIGKSFDSAGRGLRQVGGAITGFVTLPLLAVGAAAIKTASDSQEMRSAFRVVFGDAAAEAEAWATRTSKAIGRSEDTLLAASLSFGQLFTKAAPTNAEAAKLSEAFAVLATDVASFYNLTDSDALAKLRSGLAGEAEPLRAVGVFLSEAAIAAKAAQLGYGSLNGELSENEKILTRAAVIQEQLAQANGDAIRTRAGFANQSRELSEGVKDLSRSIGELLLPILQPLVAQLVEGVKWFNALPKDVKIASIAFVGLAAVVGPIVLLMGAVAGAIAAVGLPVVAVGAAIVALGAIWIAWGDDIQRVIAGASQVLANFFGPIIDAHVRAFQTAWAGLTENFRLAAQLFGEIVSGDWSGALGTLRALFDNTIGTILRVFEALAPGAISAMEALFNGVKTWLSDRLGAVFDGVKKRVDAVGGAFKDLYIAVVGRSWVPDLVDGVASEFGRLDSVMVKPTLAAAAKVDAAFAGISSPSLGAVGGALPAANDNEGIKEAGASFGGSLQRSLLDGLDGALNSILNGGKITDALKGIGQSLLSDLISGLGGVQGQGSNGAKIGRAVLGGVINGVKNSFGGGGGGGGGSFNLGSLFGGARANGGPVEAGKTYLVGERGPELFSPGLAGRIVPNRSLGGSAAGTNIVFAPVINAQGADPAQLQVVQAQLRRMNSELEQRALTAFREGQRRRAI